MWEPNASSEHNAERQRRAATGYLVWPLAFAEIVRENDQETFWLRLHARQAFVFGALASVAYVVLLAFPLLVVVALPGLSAGATIGVYTAGFVADLAVGCALLAGAGRFAMRAARGELFSIPIITPIVDRWLRIRRS